MKLIKASIIAILLSVSALSLNCRAESTNVVGTGPAPEFVPPVNEGIYFHLGPLNLTVPWQTINVEYLYDFIGQRNMLGGEAVIASLWRLQATAGAVTSLDGRGAPYIGGNLWFPNPTPQLALFNYVQPGAFGGWDFTKHAAIFGLKAAIPIFN